ncbi:MAG: hypothetical protein KatS3mg131_1369 [Candidatus Tectimicrobiota bacterium]|nr:MAG: hypothetical protein KatS3mg131_1369 [Candidatus Tectomicrobia bacterium]
MAFLAYKEACALVAEGEERAEKLEVTRDCQRKFLSDHLGRWIGAFARYLSEKAERVKADFYFRLAQLTEKFVRAECRRLDAHPTELTRLAPMAPEPPGMCDPLAGGQEGSCGPCGPCGGGGEEGGNVIWTGLSPAS